MKRVSARGFARVILVLGLASPLAGAACSGRTGTGGNAAATNQAAATTTRAARTLPQGTDDPEAVKTRLAELFALCKTGGVNSAGAYFVYRGPDKKREWKDTYAVSDPAERAAVQEGCARIKGYLDKNPEYTFGPVKVEREPEGEWHVVEVTFKQGEEAKRVVFAFLPVKGQFAVGDID